MTAQIQNTVIFQGKPYSLVGEQGTGLFDPAAYGLQPFAASTANWQGFYCDYEVIDERLRLKRVHIGLRGEQAEMAQRGEGPVLFGRTPVYEAERGEFLYELDEVMAFSGTLTMGADFVWDLYVHMGFAPPWKFREVWDVKFEQGLLIAAEDQSEMMARMRANMGANGLPGLIISPELEQYIQKQTGGEQPPSE